MESAKLNGCKNQYFSVTEEIPALLKHLQYQLTVKTLIRHFIR